jgi:hypothetical protein
VAMSRLTRLLVDAATATDRRVRWDRLPTPLGLPVLIGLREALRQDNLHHPGMETEPADDESRLKALVASTVDGSFNDLSQPMMGAAGTPFGRNVPLERTHPETAAELLTPILGRSAASY